MSMLNLRKTTLNLRMEHRRIKNSSAWRIRSCHGQGLTEFIIIVILVGLVVLVAVRLFGKSVSCEFRGAAYEIDSDVVDPGGCPGIEPPPPPPNVPPLNPPDSPVPPSAPPEPPPTPAATPTPTPPTPCSAPIPPGQSCAPKGTCCASYSAGTAPADINYSVCESNCCKGKFGNSAVCVTAQLKCFCVN